MADASYTQTSFLGGEVSQFSQGQYDKPFYKIALNKLFNSWPTDDAAVTRRPGFRFLGTTKNGQAGRLVTFDFAEASPYNLEFTDNILRMWNDRNLVTSNDSQLVQSISSATPAVFTLGATVTWQTGDSFTFNFSSPQGARAGTALLGRQFKGTRLTSTTFTMADSITGVAIGASDNLAGTVPTINHMLEITTNYQISGNDWHNLRIVQGLIQGNNLSVLLHATAAPKALTVLTQPEDGTYATFSYATAQFVDGPYLDPPASAIATPNSITSVVQLTISYPAWSSTTIYGLGVKVTYSGIDYVSLANNNLNNTPSTATSQWLSLSSGSMVNSGHGFVSTDVGRMIRLFSQPQIWLTGSTYATGDVVTYNGSYFSSLTNSNSNNQPDISLTKWVINPSGAIWTWGFITAVNSTNSVTIQIQGAPLLYLQPIYVWRLGAWSDTTGWPTCGCYQEGRLWYAGAIPNRTDSSQPNDPFNMAPTSQDGTVGDNNAISYTFNANSQNQVFWGEPDHQGIIWGTKAGEFLMTSGSTGTPMTPSNIQARRETKYGSSDVLPVRTGLTICFVKRYAQRVMEYLADILSGRFFGIDLTQYVRHLSARTIQELAFQEELVPTIWARCADGTFIGSTYRRTSLVSTQPPEFNAWHQHALGSNRFVESICVGPSVEGTLDALALIDNDESTNVRFVEQMTSLPDETTPLTQSWFLDTAVTPTVGSGDIFVRFTTADGGTVIDAGMDMRPQASQGNAMRPILATGTEQNPIALWIGGYVNPGATCGFQIKNITVSGDTPAVTATYSSSTFSASDVQDQSWALDPTGRYIAMYLQNSTSNTHQFVIFDTQALVFGTVLSVNMGNSSAAKQIGWIDSTHFVIDHVSGGNRGVEVFSVSGTTISNVGFTNIWGTSTLRVPLSYCQYIPNPNGNGLIHFTTDVSGGSFSALYGVPISWASGALVVGGIYTIASGLPVGSGSGFHANLLETNIATNEWTLCYGTVAYYSLMSFTVSPTSATLTRAWQTFVPDFGTGTTTSPIYFAETNTYIVLQRSIFDNSYRTSTIYLDINSFVLQIDGVEVTTLVATTSNFSTRRLDAKRLLVIGTTGFNFDESQVAIISDTTGEPTTVTFYGLQNYDGKKVSVFAAGIDCGDYIVTDGIITIPLGTADPITGMQFSTANFKTLQSMTADFSDMSVDILYPSATYSIPCVIGFNYESQGQLCRPQIPQDTGARNGPGFGKKRRSAKYAIQLVNSIGVKVGTKLDKTMPVPLTKIDAGGKKLKYLEMFSGIMKDTLDNDYSYDSMPAWKIDRPYPTTITAYGAFIETVDT